MRGVLIVNPFASGVGESRLAAVQAALPAGTETVLTHGPGHATAFRTSLYVPSPENT